MLHHQNILRISLLPYLTKCPSHLIFPNIITLIILARNTNHDADRYVIFSILPLLSPTWTEITLSSLRTQTSLVWKTKFYAYTIYKMSGKIISLYTLIFNFLIPNGKLKDCLPNVSRYFLNLVCSYFLQECKFYLSFAHFDISHIFQTFVCYLRVVVLSCILLVKHEYIYIYIYICRVSQEECARLRESVPYVKLYRYNPKHLYPKFNGYGDIGQRKVWTSLVSA